MSVLTWVSVGLLLLSLFLYLYWLWREEKARPKLIHTTFYGGLLLFAVLFAVFTWNTLSSMPARTHADALTAEVIAGKQAWQKYTCIDCHTILGNGAYYAPDLTKAWDRFVDRTGGDPQAARVALVSFIQNPPQATADRRGMTNYHMPAIEAQELAAFLQWTSRIDTNGWPPAPLRPISRASPPEPKHVAPANERGERAMNELGCNACHSIGGERVIGPDLKDAASKYDHATLVKWISNPEAIYRARGKKPLNKGYSEMPSLGVNEQDADAIATYLLSVSGKERQ